MSAKDKSILKWAFSVLVGVLIAVLAFVAKSYAADIESNTSCIQEVKAAHSADMKRVEIGLAVQSNKMDNAIKILERVEENQAKAQQ